LATPPPYRGYLLDLDGTLYLGDELILGAGEALRRLKARGARVMYMTNKPLYSAEAYARKLTALGIPAQTEEVLTSSLALATHMADHDRGARVLLIGEEQVAVDLQEAQCRFVTEPEAAEVVVLSWDRGFTYDKLSAAMRALRHGARLHVTHPDVACPMGGGESVPDCGALLAALRACTGREPDFIAGKPSPGMPLAALRRLGLPAEECLLVGDRLMTDIVCGRRAGLATALVMTGVTDAAALAAAPEEAKPDYVLRSVAELG
jgi:NagD protein